MDIEIKKSHTKMNVRFFKKPKNRVAAAFGDSTEQGISEFAICNVIIANQQTLSSVPLWINP